MAMGVPQNVWLRKSHRSKWMLKSGGTPLTMESPMNLLAQRCLQVMNEMRSFARSPYPPGAAQATGGTGGRGQEIFADYTGNDKTHVRTMRKYLKYIECVLSTRISNISLIKHRW